MSDEPSPVLDLVAEARRALAYVDLTLPPADHIRHQRRIKLATHEIADRGPGVYFNEIMDAVEEAAGPCPCQRCTEAAGQ